MTNPNTSYLFGKSGVTVPSEFEDDFKSTIKSEGNNIPFDEIFCTLEHNIIKADSSTYVSLKCKDFEAVKEAEIHVFGWKKSD